MTTTVDHSSLTCPRRDGEPCSVCEWLDRRALAEGTLPLGLCERGCFRMRYLTQPGLCTQCAREGTN